MRKLLIILFLLTLLLTATPIQSATMVSGRPCPGGAGAAPSCTTPTGDELTESFGDDGSTLCWTDGSSVCDNTWVVYSEEGGAISIEDSPGTPPSNTACAKSLKGDSTTAYIWARHTLPGGAITTDEAVTINLSVYLDSATLTGWEGGLFFKLGSFESAISGGGIVGMSFKRNASGDGTATHIRFTANTYCELAISEDTWYDITITIPASDSGNESTGAIAGGSSCNFTKNTTESSYIHIGLWDPGIVAFFGNIRVTTP